MTGELSQKDLAQVLGLTTRQIRNLEEQGMPARAEGNRKLYPIPDAVRWYVQRQVDQAAEAAKPDAYEKARARDMEARAEQRELEVMEARGRVVPVERWATEVRDYLTTMRSRLLALPGLIAGALPLPQAETVELIEPLIHDFMEELSVEDPEPGEDDAAA